MSVITSTTNSHIKEWRKLQQRKYREANQLFFIEGIHLVEEAINHQWEVKTLILEESFNNDLPQLHQPVVRVSDSVFQSLSQTASPQGIGAIVKMKPMMLKYQHHLLLLDRIQDPGNLGTIIRTADSAGFEGIILGDGTVDLYNDKVIRATQGSLFHLPIIQQPLSNAIEQLRDSDYQIWASALMDNSHFFHEMSVPDKVALIMGNEGEGINIDLINLADMRVKIPILGDAESLNVSIASAILIYHIALAANTASKTIPG